jgi:hypothetical protein
MLLDMRVEEVEEGLTFFFSAPSEVPLDDLTAGVVSTTDAALVLLHV